MSYHEAQQLRNLAHTIKKVHRSESRSTSHERERSLSEATSLLEAAISKLSSHNAPPPPKRHNKNHIFDEAATIAKTPPRTLSHAKRFVSGALSDNDDDSVDDMCSSILSAANEVERDATKKLSKLENRQESLEQSLDSLSNVQSEISTSVASLSDRYSSLDSELHSLQSSISSLGEVLSHINDFDLKSFSSKLNQNESDLAKCVEKTDNLSKVMVRHGEVVESLPGLLKSTTENSIRKICSEYDSKINQLWSELGQKDDVIRSKLSSEVSKILESYSTKDHLGYNISQLASRIDELSASNSKSIKKISKSTESMVNEQVSSLERKVFDQIEEIKRAQREVSKRDQSPVSENFVQEVVEKLTKYSGYFKDVKSTLTHLDSNQKQFSSDLERQANQSSKMIDDVIKRVSRVEEVHNDQVNAYESAFSAIKDQISILFRRISDLEEQKVNDSHGDLIETLVERVVDKLDEKHSREEKVKKSKKVSKIASTTREVQNLLNSRPASRPRDSSGYREYSSRTAQSPNISDYLTSSADVPVQRPQQESFLNFSPRKTRPEAHPADFTTPQLFTKSSADFESRVADIRKNLGQL
ncbi:hypothetical protein P9112_002756 [Eukaryota sp. TZLM1-RC]